MTSTLWSWAGQLVFILGGFILPRAIDNTVGKELLGIWDFSWSIVSYLSLVEFGVSSSVNRFVAKHAADNDINALNRTISSVFVLQLIVGLTILLLTVVIVLALPSLYGRNLGPLIYDAQWVISFLGLGMSIGFGFGGFAGVLTGYHRWGLYNMIVSGAQIVALVGMLTSLKLTEGIKLLGAMYALGGLGSVIAYYLAAHRVCPGLKVSIRKADQGTMRMLLGFGGKTFMNGLARSLLYQTSGLIMATYLGPATLAVYNRPLALANIIKTFTSKFAHTLTPVASGLQAAGDQRLLSTLTIQVIRAGAAMALPPAVFLGIMGGLVLELWMGPEYRDDLLPAILSFGHVWAFACLPLQTILTGLDAHGQTALASVISSAVCASTCWFIVALLGGGMYSVAICVGVTITLVDGAFVTFFTSRRIQLPISTVFRDGWAPPLLCVLPFALWLVLARYFLSTPGALVVGIAGGGLILGILYWQWIIPKNAKNALISKLISAKSRLLHA